VYQPAINWFWILFITFLCVSLVVGGGMYGLRELHLRKQNNHEEEVY